MRLAVRPCVHCSKSVLPKNWLGSSLARVAGEFGQTPGGGPEQRATKPQEPRGPRSSLWPPPPPAWPSRICPGPSFQAPPGLVLDHPLDFVFHPALLLSLALGLGLQAGWALSPKPLLSQQVPSLARLTPSPLPLSLHSQSPPRL